jgi:hypothetical protein
MLQFYAVWGKEKPRAEVGAGMRTASLAIATCLVAATAVAAGELRPKNTRITSFEPPDKSCGAFMRERAGGSANREWLAGYLTASNQFGAKDGDVGSSTDWDGMIEWLVKQCEPDPTVSFANQAFALLDHLERR